MSSLPKASVGFNGSTVRWVLGGLLSLILALTWADRQSLILRIDRLEIQEAKIDDISVRLSAVSAVQNQMLAELDRNGQKLDLVMTRVAALAAQSRVK